MSGKHDPNSPSQLKKRLMCPGSRQLELAVEKVTGKPLPDTAGETALRGILLHHYIKPCVEDGFAIKEGDLLGIDGDPDTATFKYFATQKDVDHVQYVVNEVNAEKQLLDEDDVTIWEHQVDLTELGISATDDGNRVDLCFVKSKSSILEVFEFKFGRGYVDDPAFNLQVKAYAVGMRMKFGGENVCVHILQPDAINEDKRHRQYTFTAEELEAAKTLIASVVKETANPDAPLARGYHCEFCAVKSQCPLWRDAFLNVPQHLSPTEYFNICDNHMRAEFYENLLATQKWVKDAIAAVEGKVLEGESIEGYEVGTGRMSRDWSTDEKTLIDKFPSLVVEKLMSPAEAEKQHGKAFFRENLAEHVTENPGKPKVVKSKK